jgi:trehalose/maltose hydrolase-like predicted phosphorylase
LTPENWSGRVEVISGLDGRVTNQMVARYRELAGRHLDPVSPRTFGPETIALKVRTRQSNIYVAQAARTRVFRGGEPVAVARSLHQMQDYIQQVLAFDVAQGEAVRVEKMVALFTSHDNAITETLTAAGRHVLRCPEFTDALEEHASAWTELWEVCDIELPREPRVQLLLRFHVAHVLQVCSRHTARHDAGVPARGLNGEAYRGHVFWDELYIYPFLNFRLPEHPWGYSCTATAGSPRRRPPPARRATRAPCSRGRAAATAPRKPRSCTSTRCRDSGTPTTATTSAT